jgi:6-phosphofructokinase 1
VVIGGDGSLNGALALRDLGISVVGVPASIDNDISLTEMAIGVDTALNTILEALDKIKDTASAHQRTFLIEVMGRRHGYLALMAGVAGGAEMIVLPNQTVDPAAVGRAVKTAFVRGKPHFIVVVAEGAKSEEDESAAAKFAHYIYDAGFEPRITVLGHIQRGGSPTAFDRLLGARFGAAAVDMLISGDSGKMTALQADQIAAVDIAEVLNTPPQLRPDILALADPLSL